MFADLTGTMAGSDCFNPFVIDSDYLLSSAAPARLPGQIEALPSPDVGCTCVPGFLRQRGARQTLTMTVLQVLPSADDKTSALRIISFTMLNHPGHTRRYRRFACILADAHARLAVKVVVNLSFLPDLHRLPQHRFLGTRHLDCRSLMLTVSMDAPSFQGSIKVDATMAHYDAAGQGASIPSLNCHGRNVGYPTPPVQIRTAGCHGRPAWHRIQDQLFRNQGKRASDRGALREGAALLQGLATCGHCGRSMGVRYNKSWHYICLGRKSTKGVHDGCFSTGGVRIDRLVATRFLEAVGPAGMEAALEAERLAGAERETALRSHRLELERCGYDASLAGRRYRQVDPDNRLIAATLERDWELALRALERAQQQVAAAEAERSLGRDLSKLWEAEETTARDRKRLLSCLLDDVILRMDRDAWEISLFLQWKGGRTDEFHMPVLTGRREIKRDDADTVDLLRRLAAFYPDGEIARILNRQKRVTARGLQYTGSRVAALRGRRP